MQDIQGQFSASTSAPCAALPAVTYVTLHGCLLSN